MAYNHTRNYFDFHGVRYGVGTIVKLKWEQYGCRRNIERCNGIAEFVGGMDSGYIKFNGIIPGEKYENCGIGWVAKPEDKIEEIIKPVYYDNKPTWQIALENYNNTPKLCRRDIAPGTILYIASILITVIFKDRIGLWLIETFLYLKYLVDIYRD